MSEQGVHSQSSPVALDDYRHLVLMANPSLTLKDYKPFVFIRELGGQR